MVTKKMYQLTSSVHSLRVLTVRCSHIEEVLYITKCLIELLFRPDKRGRNTDEAVLTGWLQSGFHCIFELRYKWANKPQKLWDLLKKCRASKSAQPIFFLDISCFWQDKHRLCHIAIKVLPLPLTWCLNMKQASISVNAGKVECMVQ